MLILPSYHVRLGVSCSFRECNFDLDLTPNNHQHQVSVSTYNNCFVYHILMIHFPSQCLQLKKWISLFLYHYKLLHHRSVTQRPSLNLQIQHSVLLHHDNKNSPFDPEIIFSQFPILKINQLAILNGQLASIDPSITGSPINFQPKSMLNNSDKWRLTLDVIWPKGSVIFNVLTYFLKFLHFRQFSIINHSCHIDMVGMIFESNIFTTLYLCECGSPQKYDTFVTVILLLSFVVWIISLYSLCENSCLMCSTMTRTIFLTRSNPSGFLWWRWWHNLPQAQSTCKTIKSNWL